MNKVSIRIFSPPPEFAFLGEIRDYESLVFTRRFYKPGEFELHINYNKQNTGALARNNIIVLGRDGKKAGIIRHHENQTGDSSDRDDTIIVKGPALQGILHDRIVLPDDSPGNGYDAASGTQEGIMKHFADHQAANPLDSNRKIPGLVIAADQGRGAQDNWRFDIKTYLDDALYQIGTYAKFGWEITADLANRKFVFDVRQGVNRTASQSAVPPVMFAGDWSNIQAPHYIQSWLNAATVLLLYVGITLAQKFAAKHKLNVQGTLEAVQKEVPVFDTVAGLLSGLLPAPYKAMAVTIATAIKKDVEVAEELWQSGALTEDQRKAKATELINTALALEKVSVTGKVAQAVSLTIDLAAILFLPKSHTDTTASDAAPTADATGAAQA